MSRVILLSDLCTWAGLPMTRYIGPYRTATELEKAGYDTRVIDWITLLADPIRFISEFLTPDTLAVCLSTSFMVKSPSSASRTDTRKAFDDSVLWFDNPEQCRDWFELLRAAMNRVCPEARIILGGAKVLEIFQKPNAYIAHTYHRVDYAVLGSSETTIVPLLKDIQQGRASFGQVRGLTVFVKPLVDTKTCPETVWLKKYGIQQGESLPIEVSRGCVYNCKFCYYDKKFSVLRDQESFRSELISNHDQFGTTQYHFCDDCFNDRLDKVNTVCETLTGLPFQIEWISYARADLSIKYPETIRTMIQSGAKGFFFGIETFNYEAGRAAGKGVHPDKVKAFLLDLKYDTDLMVETSFISGLPHETLHSMYKTIRWIADTDCIGMFSMAPLGIRPDDADLESVMDFSDYTKNPEKYGFSDIKLVDGKLEWSHAGMDSRSAVQMAEIANLEWENNHRRQYMKHLWWYPSYRSLGASHSDLVDMMHGQKDHRPAMKNVWAKRFAQYQTDLIEGLKQE